MGAHVALDAKAQLVAALVARGERVESLNNAKTAAARAAEMLAGAEARESQFSGLDREIERDTAARISAWATGGEQPILDPLDPDPKFSYPIARRTEAQQRAAAARSAVSTLSAAFETAKLRFVESDNAVSAAATAMMIEQAKPRAARLIEARREVWALEALLESLSSMWLPTAGGVPRPVPVGKDIADALQRKEPPWRPPGAPSPESAAWARLRSQLVGGDVEAKLGEAD